MDNLNNNEKTIKVNFENPEAHMNLTIKGKNAVNQALEIMKSFDQTCNEKISSISNINDWEKDKYPCVCPVCEKEFPLYSDHFSQLENKLYAHGKQVKGICIPERYIFKKFIKNDKKN